MPMFEYKCEKCGHTTEFLEKSSDRGKHHCEKCGSPGVHKLFSGFSVGQRGQSGQSGGSCSTGTCPFS